jgi:phage gpG-like protein
MDMQVAGVTETTGALRELLVQMLGPYLRAGLMGGGLVIEREAKKNIRGHHLIDTGNLRNSISAEPYDDTSVIVGTNVEYAAIHEYGGTIKAKNTKYLAIPITNSAKKFKPREFPGGLRVVPYSNMVAGLVDKAGHVQYLLKQSVRIPAKPYLRPAIDNNHDKIARAVGRGVRKAFGQGDSDAE